MTDGPTVTPSHVTLRVTDLDRAEGFYVSVLGFARRFAAKPDASFAAMLEAPADAPLSMVSVGKDGFNIELVQVGQPGVVASNGVRDHLALRTDDRDALAAVIAAAGGQALAHTRVQNDSGAYMMCADPDGHRLLLIQPKAS